MSCRRCGKDRLASISAKCSDCFSMVAKGKEFQGYVPDNIGIGGGDYVEMKYCLECGQIQGKFPVYFEE